MYELLWEKLSGIMKDGPLLFTFVTHEYRAFSHHLEIGPFYSEFVFSSVLDPFLHYLYFILINGVSFRLSIEIRTEESIGICSSTKRKLEFPFKGYF